ncbi:MAG: hypothetical protein ABEL76_05435, partial [Bradymonadaceae bacterium]
LKSLVWSYNCRRAERIHAAAVTYREAHGEYPDTVDEMAPTHLEDRADGLFRPAAYMLIPADDRLTVAWGPDTYYDPRHDACVGE